MLSYKESASYKNSRSLKVSRYNKHTMGHPNLLILTVLIYFSSLPSSSSSSSSSSSWLLPKTFRNFGDHHRIKSWSVMDKTQVHGKHHTDEQKEADHDPNLYCDSESVILRFSSTQRSDLYLIIDDKPQILVEQLLEECSHIELQPSSLIRIFFNGCFLDQWDLHKKQHSVKLIHSNSTVKEDVLRTETCPTSTSGSDLQLPELHCYKGHVTVKLNAKELKDETSVGLEAFSLQEKDNQLNLTQWQAKDDLFIQVQDPGVKDRAVLKYFNKKDEQYRAMIFCPQRAPEQQNKRWFQTKEHPEDDDDELTRLKLPKTLQFFWDGTSIKLDAGYRPSPRFFRQTEYPTCGAQMTTVPKVDSPDLQMERDTTTESTESTTQTATYQTEHQIEEQKEADDKSNISDRTLYCDSESMILEFSSTQRSDFYLILDDKPQILVEHLLKECSHIELQPSSLIRIYFNGCFLDQWDLHKRQYSVKPIHSNSTRKEDVLRTQVCPTSTSASDLQLPELECENDHATVKLNAKELKDETSVDLVSSSLKAKTGLRKWRIEADLFIQVQNPGVKDLAVLKYINKKDEQYTVKIFCPQRVPERRKKRWIQTEEHPDNDDELTRENAKYLNRPVLLKFLWNLRSIESEGSRPSPRFFRPTLDPSGDAEMTIELNINDHFSDLHAEPTTEPPKSEQINMGVTIVAPEWTTHDYYNFWGFPEMPTDTYIFP